MGDNFTRGANRRSRRSRSHRRGRPVQTRSVNTQSASVRAPGGGRHSLMRARRLRVTQRALFGRNCQRTARPGGCRATSALPRHLLGFLLLALCSRTLLSRLALVSLFSIIQKSRLDFFAFNLYILFVACAACASVLTACVSVCVRVSARVPVLGCLLHHNTFQQRKASSGSQTSTNTRST